MQLLAQIVTHTNTYAAWKMSQPGEGPDENWQDVTVPEMRAFLGINILMGINQLPSLDLYWSSERLFGNAGVSGIMTCNRFRKILQYFHTADRASEPQRGDPGYDRLYKVRPVMDVISDTFSQHYTVSREVSLDEAMIAFTGRLSFRQYMPAKPIKRGVKVWVLSDARNGFMSRFDIYLGRQNNTTEHGLGYNVITRLTDHLHGTFRFLFFDNFFTGVKLLEDLLASGLYACGTVRSGRKGFPADLKKPAGVKNRGDFRVLQKGTTNLTASVWKDKKLVYHLSTLSDARQVLPAQRRSGPNVIQLQQPHSVSSYNKFMGGVDLHDQLRMKYNVGRNGKKAWRYIFWFLLNAAIVNSFILYQAASRRTVKKKRFAHLDFRMELVKELIGGYSKRKRSQQPEMTNMPLNFDRANMDAHISIRLAGKTKTCKYHTRVLHKRRETVYGCPVCNVHLCQEGCHARYHSL